MNSVIDVRELKEQLKVVIQRVKVGETIIIVERGKPVGRLVPYADSLANQLEMLQEAGFLSWNGTQLPEIEPVVQNKSDILISDLVLGERDG